MTAETKTAQARVLTMEQLETPNIWGLIRWLTSITHPVHKPLFFSAAMRVMNLCLDVALFFTAALTVGDLFTGVSQNLGRYLLILVAIALTKAVGYYLEQFSGHYVAFKALELLRTTAFAKLWPQAPAVVTHSRSGDILASLTRDVDRIEVFYAHSFAPIVGAFLAPAIVLPVVGANLGWHLVWPTAICVLISLLVVPSFGLRGAFASTDASLAARRGLTHHVTDSVQGMEEVIGYGLAEARLSEMTQIESKVAKTAMRPRYVNAARRGANALLLLLSVSSVVLAGWYAGQSWVLVFAVATGFLRLFEAPRGLEDAVGYLDNSFASARRLWQICFTPQRVTDGPQTLALTAGPEISWQQVSYHYKDAEGRELPVGVDDVTITAPAGGHIVLLGVSGSGKTTLAQLLLRFDDPDAGKILIDGVDVREFELDSLRRQVAMVSQRNQQINADIATNLQLAVPTASEDEMWQVLADVELADEVRAMPEGLATPVGERGGKLSGGQVQRLCLARALLLNPKVLVLDEFTANLNVELEARIRANLVSRYPQLTIIEITHRLAAVHQADRVILVDNGRVVQQGSVAEVNAAGGPLAELLARDV